MFHQGDYSEDVQLSFDQIMQEITSPMRISELLSTASVEDDPTAATLPESSGLLQNYPNPFNPSTEITFDLPGNVGEKLDVTLAIFDINGRRVRGLIDSGLEAGSHRVRWDGRNDRGEPVPAGVYLCRVMAGDEEFTKKMALVK
jgi:flagellar hook assembly protein FlgD